MTRKKETLLIFFAYMVVGAVTVGFAMYAATQIEPEVYEIPNLSPPTTQCTEDMDCWDCETQGNRICGPGHGDD